MKKKFKKSRKRFLKMIRYYYTISTDDLSVINTRMDDLVKDDYSFYISVYGREGAWNHIVNMINQYKLEEFHRLNIMVADMFFEEVFKNKKSKTENEIEN